MVDFISISLSRWCSVIWPLVKPYMYLLKVPNMLCNFKKSVICLRFYFLRFLIVPLSTINSSIFSASYVGIKIIKRFSEIRLFFKNCCKTKSCRKHLQTKLYKYFLIIMFRLTPPLVVICKKNFWIPISRSVRRMITSAPAILCKISGFIPQIDRSL